jgi:G6PDH family F420-dependent oxidoreductase
VPSVTSFGYTLMTEQSGPRELVGHAAAAEHAGFDFEVMSDHYFPWLDSMCHAPYAWSVLGAVCQVTERVELMTYVTCPTMRYHPAVVAQKAATIDLLSDGRFTLGLGAGENLNEHVVGRGWPPVNIRHEMLEEAVHIISASSTAGTSTSRASTSASTRPRCGTCRRAPCRSRWQCPAASRSRPSPPWPTT